MKRVPLLVAGVLAIALGASAQRQDEPSIIAGMIETKRVTVTAGDLGKLPKHTIKVKTATGVATFEGAALPDVLELAGV